MNPAPGLPELKAELKTLTDRAAAYMDYHREKFYADMPAPTGLWPAIESARALLAKIDGDT